MLSSYIDVWQDIEENIMLMVSKKIKAIAHCNEVYDNFMK